MSLKKIGVLISGGGSNLQALLDKVHQIYGEIVVVISNNEDAYGLKRSALAKIDAIYLDPKKEKNNESYNQRIVDYLKQYEVDYVVLAGYMKIITPNFIQAYPNKIVNIHPALIPSFCGEGYYGMHIHKAVIDYGVKVTGASVHFVNEIPDGGPIIAQQIVEVEDDDTAESIQKKVLKIEHQLLPEVVKAICLDEIIMDGRIVKRRK
jgi:phosphoribosylglycinamide formyltransferase-1